nr:hypothetical protein [Tanacetum cinerariifolium]
MLRCVNLLQANYVIREIHMGSCSMHVGPRAVVRKAVRQGYYWPTMHVDAKKEVKKWHGHPRAISTGGMRFGLPRIIVTDNEPQLVSDPFKSWCERFEIHQMNTAVAHPQVNGLVERANRSLMEGTKMRLEREKARWVDELPNVLWAHRISIKQSNGEMMFSLTYGSEVERRETAAIREASYKSKMEQCYNKKVRSASFRLGELIFRRNKASRVEDQGKLRPKWEGPYRVMEAYENVSYKLQTLEDKE